MEPVSLSQLEVNQTREVLAYVVHCSHHATKDRRPYAKLTLCDASGQRNARKWDLTPPEAATLCAGAIILARIAARPPYKTNSPDPDLTIEHFQHREDVDPSVFLPPRRADAAEQWSRFGYLVKSVTQPDLLRLLRRLFMDTELRLAFQRAPAAQTHHHAYPGGLVEHSVEVADLALDACTRLGSLNRDLVVTGALLHDIGKIREMEWNRPGYSFTEPGGLAGHVILGAEMVRNAVAGLSGFDARTAEALQHMILSHHGRKEWGAPVEPATPEAILLHSCDLLSVQMFHCREQAPGVAGQPFQWVPALDRYMYLTPGLAAAPVLPPSAPSADTPWWEEESHPELRILAGGLEDADTVPQMAAFPIYGCIAAGSAIRSEQNLEGYRALPLTGHGDTSDFLLRVTGDSMRDAHILDGDIVRVRPRGGEPREGDIVAALVNGDATVKRFSRDGNRVLLKAENPAFPDISVGPVDEFSVQGIVVGLLRERMA